MAINEKHDIFEYAINSLNDVVNFAKFVDFAEGLSWRGDLFEDEDSKNTYQQIWFELEIINALALSEWEIEGCPADWQSRWISVYKKDASEIIEKLLSTLK